MDYETFVELVKSGDMKIPCPYRRPEELTKLYNKCFEDGAPSEICITFKQKYRNDLTNEQIERMVIDFFSDLLIHGKLKRLLLVSEYGKNYNLHYHGIIMLKSKSPKNYSDLKSMLSKTLGRTTLSAVHNQEQYEKYIKKEQHDNDEFIFIESRVI